MKYLNSSISNTVLPWLSLVSLLYLPSLVCAQVPETDCEEVLNSLEPQVKQADSLIIRISELMRTNDSTTTCLLAYYSDNYVGEGKEKTSQYYYNLLANRFYRKRQLDSSRYYLAAALRCDSILGDSFLLSTDIGIQANILLSEGKLDEAISKYQLSLQLLDKEAKPTNASAMYSNIGVAYLKKNFYESALQNFTRALEFDRKRSNVYAVESGLILKVNIGIVLKNQKKYSEAITNLKNLADTLTENNIQNDYIALLINANLASCYIAVDSLDKAEIHQNLAEKIVAESSFNPVTVYSNRINLSYHQGNATKMKEYMDKMADIFQQYNEPFDAEYLTDMGNYLSLTGKASKATEQWESALKLLEQDSLSTLKLDLLQSLGQTYQEAGMAPKAADFFSEALNHQKRMFEKNRVTAINDMLTVYEVQNYQNRLERNKIERALLLSQRKSDQLSLGLATATILLLLTGFAFYRRNSRLRQKNLQAERDFLQKQQKQKERELEFQKQQLLNRNLQIAKIKRNVLQLSERDFSDKKFFQRKLQLAMNEDIPGDFFFKDFNLFYPGFAKKLTLKFPEISNRQLQYCILIALGLSNSEIADILFVSEGAVEKSRARMAEKLGIPKTANLTPQLRNVLLSSD